MSDRYDKGAKYIDLRTTGRLFPSWINLNFKKYKLEEMLKRGDDDPCKPKSDGEIRNDLRKYQLFLSDYMDFRSPYNSVLIYHGLGSGKTASSINIYNALYNYNPAWNVFLLVKASLKGEWLDQLKKWLKKDEYEYRYKNIIFIHYDSPFADRNFMDALKNVDSAKKSLYIIDEVHNFIRNVYSNVTSGTGKRAQAIYDYIIQDKRENPDTRTVLLSGTPAINNPFELALLFNLLRPGIFPKSESEFSQHFISTAGGYQTLNPSSKNMFQRRIMGLVSYYVGATPDRFASKSTEYVDVPMSDYQDDIYNYFEDIETKLAMSMRFRGQSGSQVYKVYTRQACNFVFPPISQKVNGENRPRPGKFKLTEQEALKLSESGDIKEKDKGKLVHVSEYLKMMDLFIKSLEDYLAEKDDQDRKNKHTIMDDVRTFLTKYNNNYKEFHESKDKKSSLYEAMYISSPKFVNIIFNIMASPGPVVVYSNYVLMEGLQLFKTYLSFFGFYNYMIKKDIDKSRVGYVEYHGGIKNKEDRIKGKDVFNMTENKLGTIIKIILISPAGSEGLNLKNVRQIHIMEPYWNEVRITQTVGRGIRQCSHLDLPLDQRHVDIFRYRSVRKRGDKLSTDQYIEEVARSKEGLLQSFLDAMREVAVDCNLFKNHNMINQEYKCFQFNEPSLFDKNIGPAYRMDMADDVKLDNGSNSTKSDTVKIKVIKVKAVKLLSESSDSENAQYSKPDTFWMYPKTGVVYDYELYFPIGKVSFDNDGIPLKLNKDTYIIDYLIPIPNITQ